jgi:hypothetical protein
MARKRQKIGEILVGWGVIETSALDDALKYAAQNGRRVGEALVELELCSEDDVAKALATQFGFEYIDLDKPDILDVKVVKDLMPADLILKHRWIWRRSTCSASGSPGTSRPRWPPWARSSGTSTRSSTATTAR